MATLAPAVGSTAAATRVVSSRARAVSLPWLLLTTSAWLVGGIYLDGWAHNHGKVDSFFTPWHAVLYSGYAASAAVLFASVRLNAARGRFVLARLRAPRGYGLAVAGAVLFGLAGVLDMLWHLAFGVEVNVSALLSPTHLLLATGATLIALGPLRAAWLSASDRPAWVPVLASATLGYAVLTFMTQFAQPLVWPEASADFSRVVDGGDVYVMDADGSHQTRLTRAAGTSAGQPTWSADGRLAYSTSRPREHAGGLVMAQADGTAPVSLAENRAGWFAARPAWSPDGKWIAFVGTAEGQGAHVSVLDPATRAQRQLTSMAVVRWSSLTWSPDSQRLAFAAERGADVWVYEVGLDGGEPTPLVEGFSPAWSPDGTRLAFGSERTGALEVFSARVDGSDVRQLTTTTSQVLRRTGSWAPVWSPDGSRIAFASSRDGSLDIFVMDADGQHQVNLTQNAALDSVDPAWLPDGRLSYTGRVRGRDVSTGEALGVASILIQAALLAGLVLLLAGRWRLPRGACTAVFTLSAALLSFQNDTFQFIASAAVAGVVADVLLWRLGAASARQVRLLACAVPAAYFATYFAALAVTDGMGWPIHLWAGSVVLAGVTGLLLSLLLSPPRAAEATA
jgi:Tol biopolymer transport system component